MADAVPELRHVVVLLLENRSFDHMLGGLAGVAGASPAWSNSDGVRDYPQTPLEHWEHDDARIVTPDPKHEDVNVVRQLQGNNRGFVADYATEYPDTTPAQRQKIMSYYPAGALGPLHTLATNFAVCQRWHSSVPGPDMDQPAVRDERHRARTNPHAGSAELRSAEHLLSVVPGRPNVPRLLRQLPAHTSAR